MRFYWQNLLEDIASTATSFTDVPVTGYSTRTSKSISSVCVQRFTIFKNTLRVNLLHPLSTKKTNKTLFLTSFNTNSFSYNAAYVVLNNNEILESNSRPIYGCKTYFKINVYNWGT